MKQRKSRSEANDPRATKVDRPASGGGSEPAPAVAFEADVCTNLADAEQREWLVTNGLGGFASGTISGSATRRYHGLLVAALAPPSQRTLLACGVDEILTVGKDSYELATHRWLSGAVAPRGLQYLESFRLDGGVPVWVYRAGVVRMEKRIWMRAGENTTFIRYSILDAPAAVDLELKVLANYRDFHGVTHAGDWRMSIAAIPEGAAITAFEGATPFFVRAAGASCEPQHIWYRDVLFLRERERGLDDHEDQLLAAIFRARLGKGQDVSIVCSTERGSDLDAAKAHAAERNRESEILAAAEPLLKSQDTGSSPAWLRQLLLAADQFVVSRPLSGHPEGKTIIAGYHWFADWGRDTMIALAGLTLATGRTAIAQQILLAFSTFVDGGMLPNNFPEAGGVPGYNTMDATLWYFEAIRRYFAASQERATLQRLFPVLAGIVHAHVEGTRYNIHVDPSDGLLYGGGPGAQLTWMDAKVGDWVVTPRTGKPVEINALWIAALETLAGFASHLNLDNREYLELAARARANFRKFWNAQRNCCFDVIDAPGVGNDAALRPNQIFAVSLLPDLLSAEQQKAVVDCCASALVTPVGLRSLAPGEPGYTGRYAGGAHERDAAYHQGTVWGWLLPSFALAHFRVYRNREAARRFLQSLGESTIDYGLGSLPEIFDGDPPHTPRGCIAQAWTVGELLRAWRELSVS
ncbi:MAG TPA: amylo-alpha-1,6-glucosidase [Dongiaceae bacterium]|nr:amylo-alpha-1,6-glucosidase [Dongiaceae bacterium]